MASTYRGIYYFNSTVGEGFSETWYWTGQSIAKASVAFQSTIDTRMQLMGRGMTFFKLRINDALVQKGQRQVVVGSALAQPSAGAGVMDQPQACWLAEINDTNLFHIRNVYLRGCQDIDIALDPTTLTFQPTDDFQGRFDNWNTAMVGANIQFRALDQSQALKPVVNVMTQLVTGYTILNVPGHGFINNQVVQVLGFKGPLGTVAIGELEGARLNGKYQASVIDVNNIAIPRLAQATQLNTYLANSAKVRNIAYIYPNVSASAYLVNPTTHKTGSDFPKSHGRRK